MKNFIIEKLKVLEPKGIFKVYIKHGLIHDPDLLMHEMYEQIKQDQVQMTKIVGEEMVLLLINYFKGQDPLPKA
ncbi:MAG: hypothetical protein KGO81_07315 [Bacteroidota bacterium]|nr:hypothetical protein [Bacteroidota bacterium]